MSYFIIIRGPLGCGKTTIAKELARRVNGKYISVDETLDEHQLTEDKEEGYIAQRSFITANEILQPVAKKYLDGNIPVIIDGNFYWESQVQDILARLDYPHSIFTLKAPLATCIERDSQRDTPHGGDAAKEVYAKVSTFDVGIRIDVTKQLSECISNIVSHLPK